MAVLVRQRARFTVVTPFRKALLDAYPAVHPRPRPDRAAARPPASSFAASVALAQRAEEHGYRRVWYAEHHNMPTIASSATSVLIAHVGAQTSTIRLGAGGVMLPNHAPLTIAEQFGTLEAMYPGRIDLGLGRAPGSDQNTMYALRRDADVGRQLPAGRPRAAGLPRRARPAIPGVDAVPGKGSHVPLYILGSSLFGAPARRGARPALRVRLALRAAGAAGRRRRLPARVPPVGAARASRTSSPGSTSSPPTPASEAQRAARRRRAGCARQACSAAGRTLHRRGGRPAARPGRRRSTSTRCSPTPPSARPPRWATYLEGFAQARRRRRADRRPPVADRRRAGCARSSCSPRRWSPTAS